MLLSSLLFVSIIAVLRVGSLLLSILNLIYYISNRNNTCLIIILIIIINDDNNNAIMMIIIVFNQHSHSADGENSSDSNLTLSTLMAQH